MGRKDEQLFTFYAGILLMFQGAWTALDPASCMHVFERISVTLGIGPFPSVSDWTRLGFGVIILALGHVYVSLAKAPGATDVLMRGRLIAIVSTLVLVLLDKVGRFALMVCIFDGTLSLLALAARMK